MADTNVSASAQVAPLLRVRQTIEFTKDPVSPEHLDAIVDAARWSGSANNRQPWRFIVIEDVETIGHISDSGLPHTVTLGTAPAAIAHVLPDDPDREVVDAYDDGRAAERVLIAASMLGLAAAISWIRPDVQAAVREVLGLPSSLMVRTIMAVGHPSIESQRPRSAPGMGRLPRSETVFRDRWPVDSP